LNFGTTFSLFSILIEQVLYGGGINKETHTITIERSFR